MCEKLISYRMEWGLQGLHSLKVFKVESKCEEVEYFPEEASLPPTLTTFSISSFPNLKSLNAKGFRHLNSLKSLKHWHCNKLQCLPEEGLPTSLFELQISSCPLLEEGCEKEKGKDWLKIAHIPYICIDKKIIRWAINCGMLLPRYLFYININFLLLIRSISLISMHHQANIKILFVNAKIPFQRTRGFFFSIYRLIWQT